MDLTATLSTLVAAVALAVFAGWRGSRPPDLMRGPRMVPWRFVMVLSSAVALFMILHLMTLAGYEPPRR
jgi:hypothetical protein